MIAEFICPEDLRWNHFLSRVQHDFYHIPEYTAFSVKHEGGEPAAFYAEESGEAFLAPVLIKNLPEQLEAPSEWRDLVSPYGYPTPLVTKADPATVNRFLDAFKEACSQRDIVSAFFRLHPLLPLPEETLLQSGVLRKRGQTVFIDLTVTLEELWSQTRSGHKGDIKKLERSGFQAVMDDWSHYDNFVSIYSATMRRLSANEYYLFSKAYFSDLRSFMGERLHLCTVLSPEGEVGSAALFTTTNDIVQYHLSGSAEKYLKKAPTKLMLDFVRSWAKEMGYRLFHLGGGAGGSSDSLFDFKAGFSKKRADFCTFGMIVDEDKYSTLNEKWIKKFGKLDSSSSDFFPTYRTPR